MAPPQCFTFHVSRFTFHAVKLLDLTLPTPAENLACDEALLDLCEEEGEEILRFWEARQPFVVVGYGNRIETEVQTEACQKQGVPILRRCSGGGTVVQGPGCLNYSVTLRLPERGLLATVTGTNAFVMERNRAALEVLLDRRIAVQGHTDLAFTGQAGRDVVPSSRWLKFSGNAQRRRRRALVFHGTILYDFELRMIGELLREPSVQPDYRAHRSHSEFVGNIPARPDSIRAALRSAWQTQESFVAVPAGRIEQLRRDQYQNDAWTRRRLH